MCIYRILSQLLLKLSHQEKLIKKYYLLSWIHGENLTDIDMMGGGKVYEKNLV